MMDMSFFLAQALGIYMVIIGLAVLTRSRYIQPAVKEIILNSGMFFLFAIITLIMGIVLVLVHNIWIPAWPVIITIISWLIFISGIISLFFAQQIQPRALRMVQHPKFHLHGLIPLILGLILLYFGFRY